MRGLVLRISESQPAVLPPGQRPFAFCFEPILPRLSDFHWVSEESPVQYVGEGKDIRGIWEILEYDQTEDAVYFRPGTLLPRYAAWVKEDWGRLYGFREKPDQQAFIKPLEPLWRIDGQAMSAFIRGGVFNEEGYVQHLRQHGSAIGRYLAKHVELFFCNVDGAWWEIYAKDESLLHSVRGRLEGVRGVNVTEQMLEFRPGW